MSTLAATPSRSLGFLFAAPAVEPHMRQAFRAATLQSLRIAMLAKLAAGILIGVFLVAQFPRWAVLYWHVLVLVFVAAGVLQYRLARRGARAWYKYAFMAFDFAILAIGLLVRNPALDYGGSPVQMDLRFGGFLYFFIPLALSTFSFTPRFVLFTGACGAAIWVAAVMPIVLRADTVTLLDMPNYATAPIREKADYILRPTFVHLANLVQEAVMILIVALLLALAVSRQLGLVVRQIVAERGRAALARYFSPNMVDEIASLERPLGEVRAQNAGVLFADIVGFTALSERLGAEATMALLRGFHRRMAEVVFAHDGTVDKYIGDAIMATFGTPRARPDDALRAVHCALAMIEAMAAWNAERARRGEVRIAVGIGLHYGAVVAGDLGDERRLEYAVIGETVNLASRLEALTRERGVSALVSGEAMAAARAAPGTPGPGRPEGRESLAGMVSAGTATVRGRAEPVALWAPAPPG